MLLYVLVGAFGLLFLLAMLLLGDLFGDHEVHVEAGGGGDIGAGDHALEQGTGPSVLSARVMAAFVTAFGGGGAIARYYGYSHPASSGVGIVSGLVLGGVVYEFARILYSQQASSEVRTASLIGRTAEICVAIPSGGVGQITVTCAGERSTQIARSEDGAAIPAGTEVVIKDLRGDSFIVARSGSKPPGGQS